MGYEKYLPGRKTFAVGITALALCATGEGGWLLLRPRATVDAVPAELVRQPQAVGEVVVPTVCNKKSLLSPEVTVAKELDKPNSYRVTILNRTICSSLIYVSVIPEKNKKLLIDDDLTDGSNLYIEVNGATGLAQPNGFNLSKVLLGSGSGEIEVTTKSPGVCFEVAASFADGSLPSSPINSC